MSDSTKEYPKYFTNTFFQNSLNIENKITNFEVSLAVGKGDNYTSSIYRVLLNLENDRKKSIVVKCFAEEGKLKEIFDESDFFDVETLSLAKFMPDVTKMLMSKMSATESKLSADLYYHRKSVPACFILEDLNESGYKSADRKKGLDLDHCKLVFSKLAKLHAAGKILYEENPANYKQFFECPFTPKNKPFLKFAATCFEAAANQTRKWNSEYSLIADKLINLKDKVASNIKSIYREDCPFKVVNHGDLWVNNMMFSYKDGKVDDVVLVDFQCCFYGSPAVDLLYFIYGSCHEEVFWNNRQELIQYYYTNLSEALKSLKYEGYIPSLQELEKEMEICNFMAVYTTICVKPIIMHEDIKDSDDILDEIGENAAAIDSVVRKYSNPKLADVFKSRLKIMDSQEMFG